MKITKITVEYGELVSTGYPDFANRKAAFTYEAECGDDTMEHTWRDTRLELLQQAMTDTHRALGKLGPNQCLEIKVIQKDEIPF